MSKKIFAFLCFLLLLLAFRAIGEAAVPEDMEPKVVSVDFYPHGAKFVFQLTTDGERDFEFTLPGSFIAETVRPLMRGTASMRAELVQVKPEPFPELEPLEKTVSEKRREVRLWDSRINAVNQAQAMINATISSDVSGKELIAYLDKAVDKASDKRLQYELTLVDLRIGREEAQKELKEAEEELQLLRSELGKKSPDRSRVVRVRGTTPRGTATV